jgi:hypothetical protein
MGAEEVTTNMRSQDGERWPGQQKKLPPTSARCQDGGLSDGSAWSRSRSKPTTMLGCHGQQTNHMKPSVINRTVVVKTAEMAAKDYRMMGGGLMGIGAGLFMVGARLYFAGRV